MGWARRRMAGYREDVAAYEAVLARYRERLADPSTKPSTLRKPAAPEPPRIIPVLGDPIYCQACTHAVKAKLARLDVAAAIAARESDGMRGTTTEAKVRSTPGPASPSPTIDELEDLEGWLRSWKAAYLGADEVARLGSLMDAITYGTAWLVHRAERILRHRQMAVPFAEETLAWYARLDRYDPTDVTVQRMPLRCPGCKRFSLERRGGEDVVRCRTIGCVRGESISMDQYTAMVEQQAMAAKAATKTRTVVRPPRPRTPAAETEHQKVEP
ncbi:hypothetical protein [Sphaerimonospora thailandensis]|nr:hypothetical protein [Sphaerimonospora thailandensis]